MKHILKQYRLTDADGNTACVNATSIKKAWEYEKKHGLMYDAITIKRIK